ncbi:MAG: CDP-diacylglycerol--serine O-phosphatidyltransferase [Desulfatitalea sp.]|nr:CDP-diacylglycerol--serine O-phosphatidyltransferase [Desulfatitalea sp.]
MRKGAYLLPNLCTTMNMFCGFYSIVAAIDGNYITAAYAILIAGIFDNLDGKIARATRSTSNFGVEFDSLADLLSFGMAPGIMMYLWVLKPLGRIGWLAGFLFVVCGALRLARFNTRAGKSDARFFLGLPIPAAAGMTAVTVMFCHKFGVAQQSYPFIFLVLLYGLSFLMVSTIRYSSFKKIALFSRMNFNVLVGAILVLIFIAAQPAIALFLLGAAYVVSGPLLTPWQRRRARRLREEASEEEDQVSAP